MTMPPRRSAGAARFVALCGVAATILAAALVAPAAARVTAAAAPRTAFGPAVEVKLPSNAASRTDAQLVAVSCPAARACVAGGFYVTKHGQDANFVVRQVRGRWSSVTRVPLPANAAGSGFSGVNGIWCTAPGFCEAVGSYTIKGGGFNPFDAFVAAEVRGSWRRAQELAAPAMSAVPPQSALTSVACPSRGNCVAVGEYFDNTGGRLLMAATQTNGRWGPLRALSAPMDASSPVVAQTNDVSCIRPGVCVADGWYDRSPAFFVPLAFRESGGTWRRAISIGLPANAEVKDQQAALLSVSCPAATLCVAVGDYFLSSGQRRSMALAGRGKLTARASEVMAAPKRAGSNPSFTELDSVSCISAKRCVAIGVFQPHTGKPGMMSLIRSGGRWGAATQILLPANAAPFTPQATDVSCTGTGYCAAVGSYSNRRGDQLPMAAVMP